MTPLGPRLIQPQQYTPAATRPSSFGISRALLVERHAVQRHAPVADRAQRRGRTGWSRSRRSARATFPPALVCELVADHLDRLDPAVAADRHRRGEKRSDRSGAACPGRPGAVLAQQLDVRRAVARPSSEASLDAVELESAAVDDDVGARELAELAQLRVGERRLRGPAPAEHDDLLHGATRERVERVIGDVGRGRAPPASSGEHSRHVDRDVAVADHDRPLAGEVELEVLRSRGGRCTRPRTRSRARSGQVLARDAEPAVGLGADGVDDGVVERSELVTGRVAADLDVAEEAEPRASAIFSKTRETALIFGWSGATPRRTSPQGVGSRSIMSTAAPAARRGCAV